MRGEHFRGGAAGAVTYHFREAYTGNTGMHHKHVVRAVLGGKEVGRLEWHTRTGTVTTLHTDPELRRQGVATGMWQHAHQAARTATPELHDSIVPPVHSDILLPEGAAWKASLDRRR